MTTLRREAIQLVEQMQEEQMSYIIQFIHALKNQDTDKGYTSDGGAETSKMSAFLELEKMLVPISPELDYDKELAEARDERYDNASQEKVFDAIERKEFSDFEDCLQDECAKEVFADFIVTRNVEDFRYSRIKAVTPQELLEIVKP